MSSSATPTASDQTQGPAPLANFALALADDALVHAQRLCEWSGRAPTLEEDLALANVGLDYLGRARQLYGIAGGHLGRSEDQLAYLRDSAEYRNLLMLELPRGDFALTMVRQYLLDEFELRYFALLAQSRDAELAAVATKTLKEVQYHLRRSDLWLKRLGLGTAESNRRAQAALDQLWGYSDELFALDGEEQALVDAGLAVDRKALQGAWLGAVSASIHACQLQLPKDDWQVSGGRDGLHTEHLGKLLGEMQILQRNYPNSQW